MRRVLRFIALLSFLCVLVPAGARSASIVHAWSKTSIGTGREFARSVAADPSGNVIVAGAFNSSIDLGGGNLVSSGSFDIFVVKYDAAGTHQWSKRFGDASSQFVNCVATDASGDVIITGEFAGTVNFGGANLVSSGGNDIYVAKFNAAGTHVWSQRFGDGAEQVPRGVAVNAAGDVLITGEFAGTVNFGGGNLVSAGGNDIFVAKFDAASGAHVWSQRFGSSALEQQARAVAVDATGNVVITGEFEGTVNFGGGNLTSVSFTDIFVAKYNASGVHQWSKQFGAGDQHGHSVATDGAGNLVVTGDFSGTLNFGGGNLTSPSSYNIFVARFNASGVHQWSKAFGAPLNSSVGRSVVMDAAGNVIVGGVFSGTVNFGGASFVSAGSSDMFVAGFDGATGKHRWSRHFGGPAGTMLDGLIAVDSGSNVLGAGSYYGTVNLGGADLVAGIGNEDAFFVKYAPTPDPTILGVDDVGNDQGRQVRIRFERSIPLDVAGAPLPIKQYEAYLRSDPLPASASPTSRLGGENLLTTGWAFVGAVPAHAEHEYEIYVSTLADSTIATGQHYSVFFIRAATGTPAVFYDSPPDSGYSLDNLGPGIPAGLIYNEGQLSWDESSDSDFDHFSVYGANTGGFGSANFVDYTPGVSLDVSAAPYAYYFVTATDRSGNEGQPAAVRALAEGGTPGSYVLSVSAYPNPFNPSTTIRYTVPSRGPVTIGIFDARGARVKTLLDAVSPEGAHTVPWDGRDEAGGRVSSGIYFARIAMGGQRQAHKLVLLK